MKIAICGSSHLSAHTTPETDDWQIWATSPGSMNQLKRADKWFEFHRWVPFIRQSRQFMDFLKAFKGPVYTAGEIPEIPNAVRYPIEEVEREFSSYFLTSSCALMMALAILEKPEVIGLFGIDMAERSEYRDQRPGAHFFILEALRRGIGIYVPVESVLLRPAPVYGFCEWTQEHIQSRLRSAQMSELLKQERKTIRESQARCERYEAMAQDLDYMINMWSSPYGLPSGKTIRSKDEN